MKIWKLWTDFWFSPVPLLNLALFRIVLAATMLGIYIPRQLDLNLFFTENGILPKQLAFEVIPEFFRPASMLAFWPDSWVPGMHLLLLLGLFCLVLGVGNRGVSTLISVLVVYLDQAFLQRNMSVMFGADQIGGIFLLYLALADHSKHLSVQAYFNSKKPKLSTEILTPMFYRLIQVQLCIVYAYTGFEKLKGNSWWDGTALWSVFANPQFVIADMTWVRHFPWAIVAACFMTILFEIYFPVLVWIKAIRKYVLSFGVLFHTGIAVVMALYGFALVMMAPYLLFIDSEFLKITVDRLKMRFVR